MTNNANNIVGFYTGIGSRMTPQNILDMMIKIGSELAKEGHILRSGAADGADTAFEKGCIEANGKCEIFLPWKKFNHHLSPFYKISDEAMEMAAKFHPAWSNCSYGAKKLHARNCYQVLGQDLITPSFMVLCWTDPSHGGTLQAVRVAKANDIPVYNIAEKDNDDYEKIMMFIGLAYTHYRSK